MKKWMRVNNSNYRFYILVLLLTVIGLFLSGCAGKRLRLAEELRRDRHFEQALEQYLRELKAHPDRLFLKLEIDKLLKEGADHFNNLGAAEVANGNIEQAVFFYRKTLEFDPGDSRGRRALTELQQIVNGQHSFSQIKAALQPVTEPTPFADSAPIDFEFRSKTSLMEIFRLIGSNARLNILFDPEFKDLPVTVSLKQISFAGAMQRLCQMFGCRYYVLDDSNLLLAIDTPASRERYQNRVLKTLYFSNIDAEEAKQIIDSVFKSARMITNKQGNALIVVDSLENMAIVEKIAQFIDKRRGEVEIEAEILEIDSKKLREFGSELSSWSLGASLANSDKGFSPDALKAVDISADLRLALPNVLWKFLSTVTDSKILARPRIRGLDKERIEIQLGEKRPIPTTTFVPVAQGGVNQQPITSYTLTDVGILLNITPTIHYNEEITLDMEFVLTYVIDIGGTFLPPTLGNRRVTTKLRLRNGETGIIAGLMRGSSTSSRTGVPILNQIPLLRDIFSSNKRINERTDILLSITPRILRMPDITSGDMESWLIGTSAKAELRRLSDAAKDRKQISQAAAAVQEKNKKPKKKSTEEKREN